MKEKDPLHFNETYSFEVLVKDNKENFAGKLIVSPNGCTLRVMGERAFSENFSTSEVIECETLRNWFLLTDLSINTWRIASLRMDNKEDPGGFYEIEFKVGFLIKSSSRINSDTLFKGFNFDADMIGKWTGITNKQNDLLYRHRDLGKNDLTLFTKPLDNLGDAYLSYNLNLHTNLEGMSSGVKLTPNVGIFLNEHRKIQDIYKEIKKLYVLLTYFWGGDFSINHLLLSKLNGDHISAFYSMNVVKDLNKYPLIPLGFDTRDNYGGFKGVPLEFFINYYNLPDSKVEHFSKHLRYKRMKSNEERFLGYFRILEKLVHVRGTYVEDGLLKDLLKRSKGILIKKLGSDKKNIERLSKRIISANGGKYNTATCISKFFNDIPEEIRSFMGVSQSDIEPICKLRNDMTHANEYEVLDENLHRYTRFIHQLLIFALFNKSLGLSLDLLIPLSGRFSRI
ncbi:HEPN domain-containing protein [Acinetobacter lwoffii]|uniref:HEPN domain-containing protein n=1 Tax=Acinetobacter lwoffii TaxID=28090 RepID=UPI0032B46528